MAVLPAPSLPAKKTHKRPKLVRFGYAFGLGLAMAVGVIVFVYFVLAGAITGPLLSFAKVYAGFAFCLTFGLYYFMDLSEPSVTMEEIWYRKRLEMALNRDNRVAQLNADHDLLTAAADELYKKVGKDEFAKLKNSDVVNYAIEMARTK